MNYKARWISRLAVGKEEEREASQQEERENVLRSRGCEASESGEVGCRSINDEARLVQGGLVLRCVFL